MVLPYLRIKSSSTAIEFVFCTSSPARRTRAAGFHRIRHYGLFAKAACADNIARARQLLGSQKSQGQAADTDDNDGNETPTLSHPCPCCGGRMIIIEIFERGATPGHRPTAPISLIKIDTS